MHFGVVYKMSRIYCISISNACSYFQIQHYIICIMVIFAQNINSLQIVKSWLAKCITYIVLWPRVLNTAREVLTLCHRIIDCNVYSFKISCTIVSIMNKLTIGLHRTHSICCGVFKTEEHSRIDYIKKKVKAFNFN